ncbi:hypothetical protein GCM10022384_13340 [Streptomyces marokkonensis]|uniref:Uncharacterized protein n=2 Tax=Streptomyces marokkonensis TaxID=324855 RepID=A0ABP7PAH5_9ACTN
MGLAIGVRRVYVMMKLFARDGSPKLVPRCVYPLTGTACVSRVHTDHGVFATGPDGVRVLETYGISPEELRERLAVHFRN